MEIRACVIVPCRFSPPGDNAATLTAPKGESLYTKDTTSGAAPTSPPEGVLRSIRHKELDDLSGHTTGRLRYTGQTTDYAIGEAATLAL